MTTPLSLTLKARNAAMRRARINASEVTSLLQELDSTEHNWGASKPDLMHDLRVSGEELLQRLHELNAYDNTTAYFDRSKK